MSQLGNLASVLGVLAAIGGLFILQYRWSLKEKRWGIFVLPLLLTILYLGVSLGVALDGQRYTAKDFFAKDNYGNFLEMTVQVPHQGDHAKLFSDLYVYDKNHILLDEIFLQYKNGVLQDFGFAQGYESTIARMTHGLKLDGTSMTREEVRKSIAFFGITIGGNPFLGFSIPFAIPVVLLALTGVVTRIAQAGRLRRKSMNKIDIQSIPVDKKIVGRDIG